MLNIIEMWISGHRIDVTLHVYGKGTAILKGVDQGYFSIHNVNWYCQSGDHPSSPPNTSIPLSNAWKATSSFMLSSLETKSQTLPGTNVEHTHTHTHYWNYNVFLNLLHSQTPLNWMLNIFIYLLLYVYNRAQRKFKNSSK